jgi:hypothetical protein
MTSYDVASIIRPALSPGHPDQSTPLTTHVLVITLDSEPDRAKFALVRAWLGGVNRTDFGGIDQYLELSPGVDPLAWPAHFEDAEYGVRGLEAMLYQNETARREGVTDIGQMGWVQAVQEARDNAKYLPAHWQRLAHHVGCLFAHLHQWQKAADRGWDDTIIMESDAAGNPGTVPASAFQDIVNHHPSDYDVIFTHQREVISAGGVSRTSNRSTLNLLLLLFLLLLLLRLLLSSSI